MGYVVIFEKEDARRFKDERVCIVKNRSQLVDAYAESHEILRFNHYEGKQFEKLRGYCNSLTEFVFPILCDFYEEKYKLGMDLRFYERIFYPWLIQYIQAIFDRYLSLKSILNYDKSAVFAITELQMQKKLPLDVKDYAESVSTDPQYNACIFSEIVRQLGWPHITLSADHDEQRDCLAPKWGSDSEWSWAKKVANRLVTAFAPLRALTGQGTHLLHSCYGCGGMLNILRIGRMRWAEISPAVSLPAQEPDTKFRQQKLQIGDGEFETLLGSMLLAGLPMGLCEYLPALVAWARKQRLPKKGIIATSIGQYTNLPLIIMASVHRKPLAIVEHGCTGMRGLDDFHEKLQMHVADRYFSTGGTKYVLESAQLAKKVPPQKLSRPLLVCSDASRYCARMEYDIYGQPVWYHQQRLIFLDCLDKAIFPEVRLYFVDRGLHVKDGLTKKFPQITYQDAYSIPIEQAMAESCLTILDHVGTTLPKAMATNLPFIIFSTDMHLSKEALAVIAVMRDAQIWHDSPESAAQFYAALMRSQDSGEESLRRCIQQWWQSEAVQNARAAFCASFACVSPDWESKWRAAFDKLCSDGVRSSPLSCLDRKRQ